jgi:hypothetical protein
LLLRTNGQCETADRKENDGKYCGLHVPAFIDKNRGATGGPAVRSPSQSVCPRYFARGSGIKLA